MRSATLARLAGPTRAGRAAGRAAVAPACRRIFSAHSASVAYGCFANNGRNVLTASDDGTVRVWNPKAGTVDHCLYAGSMADPVPISSLAAHPSHPVFLFGAVDGGVKLAHAEGGRVLATLAAHDASVESVGFCDCLQLAASAAMDGKLCVWDLTNFSVRHTCMHSAGVIELKWLKDAVSTTRPRTRASAPRPRSLAAQPRREALAHARGSWPRRHDSSSHAAQPLLLSCSLSRELRLWDSRSGDCLQTLIGHHDAVLCMDVAYTAHGIYIVSGSDDKSARLWRPGTAVPSATTR